MSENLKRMIFINFKNYFCSFNIIMWKLDLFNYCTKMQYVRVEVLGLKVSFDRTTIFKLVYCPPLYLV